MHKTDKTTRTPKSNKSNLNKNNKVRVSLNPLATYKGVVGRFFLLYKHVLGLIGGGFIAHIRMLPEYKKSGLRSAGSRLTAFLLRPFVSKNIRSQTFAVQLRLRLEMLGPTYVKLGQIMAVREDILPKDITNELKHLLSKLPEVDFDLIKDIIEDNLGASLEELFEYVEEKSIGSASIGQSHLAQTKNNERVVIKVIKPGIRDIVLLDLKLLKILARILEWFLPRYQPKLVLEEFCRYTEMETDLTYEADHAELFAANFADYDEVAFPRIYRQLSSKDVLCMEFFDGTQPNDPEVFEMTKADRKKIVDIGTGAIIKMLYDDGFFHADLHAGNLIAMPGPVVGFIDVGMVGRFEERMKSNMLYYFYSLVNGEVEHSARYLLTMAKMSKGSDPFGFKRAVGDLCRRYYLRASDGNFSLAQLILESIKIGGKYRIFFPVEMTLMVKALVTFEGVGQMLDPNLDVPGLSRKHIGRIFSERYNIGKIAKKFSRSMPELVDVFVQLPELMSDGSRYLNNVLHNPPPKDGPIPGLKSSIIAGFCIIGGVLAVVQDAQPALWVSLFAVGIILALFGK